MAGRSHRHDACYNTDETCQIVGPRYTGELYGAPATGRRVAFPAVAVYRCNDDNTMVRHETLAYDTGFIIAQVREGS